MNLFSLFGGGSQNESVSETTSPFNPDSIPYGLSKPAKECSVEDIRHSNDLFRDVHADCFEQLGLCYELTTALDYKSTLLELALHGVRAPTRDELPLVPYDETGYRVMEILIDPEDSTGRTFAKMVAETKEELEMISGAGIYKTKTKKKETGKCYFVANIPLPSKPGKTAGIYLKQINHLTRRLILGENLVSDFEASMNQKIDPQDWIDDRLGHLRKSRPS